MVIRRLTNALARPIDSLLQPAEAATPVDRPILIVGAERSGTTLLYSLLSNHRDLYWLSRLDTLIPDAPAMSSRLRRLLGQRGRGAHVAVPGTISRSSGLLPPSECVPYWQRVFGYPASGEVDDGVLTEQPLDPGHAARIHADLAVRLALSGQPRLLFKQPGFTLKLRFLNALFPDARFIHIVREPFDNLHSLVKAKQATQEPFWGAKIPGWQELLSAPPALQAAHQLHAIAEIIDRDLQHAGLAERCLQVRFEDLQAQPVKCIDQLLNFCELDSDTTVMSALNGIEPRFSKRDYNAVYSDETVQSLVQSVRERHGYV